MQRKEKYLSKSNSTKNKAMTGHGILQYEVFNSFFLRWLLIVDLRNKKGTRGGPVVIF